MERIEAASRPVMMVGVEVRRFGIESRVEELARRLHVPVVTSFMGRGLLAGSQVPVLGTYLGLTAHPDVGRPVEESDCLLLFGVTMSDTNFGVSEGRVDYRNSILAVDRSVSMGFHRYGNIPLAALVDELARRVADQPSRPEGKATEYPRDLVPDDGPIAPVDIAKAVNDLFARAGRMPVASDCGDCLFTSFEIENTEIVAPGYYATMGFGVPAALGVQAATGKRPLVLVGDGAFQMTGWELGNCRRYGWDPDRDRDEQPELGDAACLPAGVEVQHARRLALCRCGCCAGRRRRARVDTAGACIRTRSRCRRLADDSS